MGTKTIEKIIHKSTPKGLKGLLHVKWTDGRELLRNSKRFNGKEGWKPASTVGTRVVFDTDWNEYGVYVYINETRFYQLDSYRSTKSEALEIAQSLRLCSDWTVRQAPKPKASTKKAKPSSKKKTTAKKVKTSPKGKKSSPKVTHKQYVFEIGDKVTGFIPPVTKKSSPKVTKKATKPSPKVKPVAKKAVARRARKAKPQTLKGFENLIN
jgi:hypothetical protein